MKYKMIGAGAEAKIYKDGEKVIKDRVKKGYRHPKIDESLRKSRTRREAKILDKLKKAGFPAPGLVDFDDKNMKINMDYIEGDKLKDVFHENPVVFSKEIGNIVGMMHNLGIIHHDLTTSNMILKGKKIHIIDFGLSFVSERVEDMAVDLHLLDRAMESRHHKHYPECFNEAVKGYLKTADKGKEVLKRFEQVAARGRNKNKH